MAKKAPHSHSQCAEQAVHMKALMVSDRMPTLWITLNPFDLRSPLVLCFAGVQLDTSIMNVTTMKQMQESTATMNPVAVAQFFDTTCKEIFCHLLKAGSSDGGLFGPVSTYFETVETNGRGILHLHCLIWLASCEENCWKTPRMANFLIGNPRCATSLSCCVGIVFYSWPRPLTASPDHIQYGNLLQFHSISTVRYIDSLTMQLSAKDDEIKRVQDEAGPWRRACGSN